MSPSVRDFAVGAALPADCVLHKGHRPAHLTTEFHHVVPVAWQLMWQPPEPWRFPGYDPDGRGKLWDNRGVEVCPTGHRNVHFWLVRLMHAVTGENPVQAAKAVRAIDSKARGIEFQTALWALVRWKEGGGSLQMLVAAHEWGMS